MVRFICKNCKYKFLAINSPKKCPYCDKSALESEKSAEEIISEVESILIE